MYSAVLMLALTAGSETADFGHNRCNGASNCCGVVAYNSCGGCAASHGCYSNGHGRHGCNGCNGGGLFSHGRHGCNNACNGYRCNGCSGYYGCSSYQGCSGCTGGVIVVPEKKKDMPKGEKLPDPTPKKETRSAAPATIIVSVPAGARLIVDGAPTTSTTERRTLVTPNLQFGSTYYYTMRAEIVRDGQTVVQTQDVMVRGGETSTVQFQFPQTVESR
jgi:uncharacterized protein (TIGR03000 family)